MRTAARSEAIGAVIEVLLVNCAHQHDPSPLDYFVLERRLPNRSLAPIIFLQIGAHDRRRVVLLLAQPLVQTAEVRFQVGGVLLGRHPVYSRTAIFPRPLVGFPQQVHIYQVGQVREHPICSCLRLLCYPLKSR